MRPESWQASAKHLAPILITALVGALASGGAWYAACGADDARIRGVLELRAEWRARDLERKLQQSTNSVQALATLVGIQHDADPEFLQRFASNAHRSTGPIRRLGWAPRVVRNEAGEPRVFGRAGAPVPSITEQGPDDRVVGAEPRAEHFPISVESVVQPAPALLGFDVISRPYERSTAYRARDAAEMTGTPPQPFVTTADVGYVVYMPVYWGADAPESTEDRRSRLRGFAFGTFLVSDVLKAAIEDTPSIVETIRFHVRSAASNPVAEYRPDSGIGVPQTDRPTGSGQIEITRSFEVVGQQWVLHFGFGPEVLEALRSAAPKTWLIIGFLATGSLMVLLLRERRRKLRVEEVVSRRTAELNDATDQLGAALGNIPQGLSMFDKDRKLLVCNARYAELYRLPPHLARPGPGRDPRISGCGGDVRDRTGRNLCPGGAGRLDGGNERSCRPA